ncbi:ComEC family competence protein [Candidatus Kaiserbacteria bacterium]|nr:ComEC family competence protein [Candidatus Kaiserbacteria bacterium]
MKPSEISARILWAIIAGFFLGVFVRSLSDISWPIALFCLFIAAIVCALAYLDAQKRAALIVAAVCMFSLGAGIMRMDLAHLSGDLNLNSHIGEEVTVRGFVVTEPDVREKNVRLIVQATDMIYHISSLSRAIEQKILVIAPLYTEVEYGDEIIAKGTLQLPEKFETSGGREFDYPMYLAKNRILYTLAFAEVEKTGAVKRNPAKSFAFWVKRELLRGLRASVPEPEAGLAAGITLGEKRSLGGGLTAVFQRASLVHIVVLSGYNITVVINAAAQALRWTPRSMRFGASGIVVLFFILMTGGAATAVRAGLMALLAVYARNTGRVFLAARILALVCLAMIMWNPYTLLYDPSFQLSALATLGLILFTSIFAARLQWITEKMGLREIVASTLATQFVVLPLLLYQNGNLSIVALPANLFALIAVPAAMALSTVAAVLGVILGPLAPIVGFPAYLVLAYIIKVAEIFSALPFASVSVPAFSALWVFAAYALLLVGYWYIKK